MVAHIREIVGRAAIPVKIRLLKVFLEAKSFFMQGRGDKKIVENGNAKKHNKFFSSDDISFLRLISTRDSTI